MQNIRGWGLMLLFISAGSLIYCFLLPSGNISRTAKSVVSITVLSAVFFPLFGVFPDLSSFVPELDSELQTESFEDYALSQARTAVEDVIDGVIKNFTSVPHKCEIFIDKTGDGGINIEYVGVIFSAEPQKKEGLRQALFEALGIMPDIKVEYVSE